jgi:hypothetical protein
MPIRARERARYPKNWVEISLSIRSERAGWQCECDGRCGSDACVPRCVWRQGQKNLRGSAIVLTVAHLDHTPENCDPENLRAMCQACHLRYDRHHHANTRRQTRLTAARQGELF